VAAGVAAWGTGPVICHLGLTAREAPPRSRAAGRNLNLVYPQINEQSREAEYLLPSTFNI
jgi:hypothetical protein